MDTRFKNFIYVGVTVAYSMIREERGKKSKRRKKAKRLSMRVPMRSTFFCRENESLEGKHTEEVQGFLGL